MNHIKTLVLSVLCTINFLSHGMEIISKKEAQSNTDEIKVQSDLYAMVKSYCRMGRVITDRCSTDTSHELLNKWHNNLKESHQASLKTIQTLVNNGAEKDQALGAAALYGNYEMVKFLVEAGAQVNTKNEFGITPLIYACDNEHIAIAKYFIEMGADVNMIKNNGHIPLLGAIRGNNTELIDLLTKAGATINTRDQSNKTPLIHACANGCSKDMDKIMRKRMSSVFNGPLVHDCVESYCYSIAKNLIKAGADVNAIDNDGNTALTLAIEKKNIGLIVALINAKANLDVCDQETLLKLAIKSPDITLVQALIDNNGIQKDEALLLAIDTQRNPRIAKIKALLKAGAHVNVRNKKGELLLIAAIKNHDVELVEVLIENDFDQLEDGLLCAANIHVRSLHGYDEAHERNRSIINLLINAGAYVNIQDKSKATPLMLACYRNYTAIAQYLIKHGADVNIADNSGDTPLTVAIRNKNIELIKALMNAKADIPDASYIQVLEWAVQRQEHDMSCQIVTSVAKHAIRKKIEMMFMGYNQAESYLSELPKEILKMISIITLVHPEYSIDTSTVARLHPQVLVDTIPLKTLSMLIKNGTLDRKTIFIAWKDKLATIARILRMETALETSKIKDFALRTLNKINTIL